MGEFSRKIAISKFNLDLVIKKIKNLWEINWKKLYFYNFYDINFYLIVYRPFV